MKLPPLHHTATARGYVSRVGGHTKPIPYSGKFGKGFTTFSPPPRWDTTRWCFINYYIIVEA